MTLDSLPLELADTRLAGLQLRLWVYEQLDQLPHGAEPGILSHLCLTITATLVQATRATLTVDQEVIAMVGDAEMLQPNQAVYEVPLMLGANQHGAMHFFDLHQPVSGEIEEMITTVTRRWAREWSQIERLAAARVREVRLEALLDIAGLMSSTLDRQQLLQHILTYACGLLDAEAASIFILEPETGDLVLRVASGATAEQVQNVRVPKGKGIAGFVAQTGQTAIVNDPANDPRFYGNVDEQTKFHTRSLVCVPLRSRAIQLGDDLGATEERIVGVAQVLNRFDGEAFSADDVTLFMTLCSQAATVMEVAELYANMQELFTDVIEAITAAIDAKDQYTEGHSRRVSAYATEIARELGLSAEFVWQVRISGILHDVGKIGVPDAVLKKPGPLTDEEFEEIKKHPAIGARIMSPVRLLKPELPGLFEHHEHLDGRGYPRGLRGEEISLMGRIIAVADAFDAMTSDRAYRAALSMEEVTRRINDRAGTQWDANCVAALWRAYDAGRIAPQMSVPRFVLS